MTLLVVEIDEGTQSCLRKIHLITLNVTFVVVRYGLNYTEGCEKSSG